VKERTPQPVTNVALTDGLKAAYPGFTVCWAELSGLDNRRPNDMVDTMVGRLPATVTRDAAALLERTEPMHRFFRSLNAKARYHIRSLVKSTVNGREYRSVNPAVDILYTVELETGLLMSMHDLSRVNGGLVVDVNESGDAIDNLAGDRVPVRPTDIVVRDQTTVLAALTVGLSRVASVQESSEDVVVFAYGSPNDPTGHLVDAVDLACERMREALSASVARRETISA
jgi:DNA/RNA-binding domain of Phe-tRNA-synthetase-like protein